MRVFDDMVVFAVGAAMAAGMVVFAVGAPMAAGALFWCTDHAWAGQAPATAFDEFLAHGSPACVPVADIEKKAVAHVDMTQEQFRFAQAIYVALPPVSPKLPVGDKGVFMGDADGNVLAVLTDGDQACARIQLPPFMIQIFEDVLTGKVEHAGDPT